MVLGRTRAIHVEAAAGRFFCFPDPATSPREERSIRARDETRVNERIRVPMVRVVDEDGTQVGVMAVADAIRMAREKGLDLVEVATQARPPVCRIMDYGRYKYELSKRQRKARQKAHQTILKEVKMSPKIGEHDLQVKLRRAREFLEKRDKVKFTVRFRGREITHMEFGQKILKRIAEELDDIAVVELSMRRERNLLSMVLAPRANK